MRKRILIAFVLVLFIASLSYSLILRYDRYYNYKEVFNAIQKIKAKYPKFVKIETIGKSYQERDLWAVTINNPDTGKASDKPAMYVDESISAITIMINPILFIGCPISSDMEHALITLSRRGNKRGK